MKRKLALFLAFIMLLGMLPTNAFAATGAGKPAPKNDKNYEEVTINGRPYKVYKVADLLDASSAEQLKSSGGVPRSANPLADPGSTGTNDIKFVLDLSWSTIDRPIDNVTMFVYAGPPSDSRSIKLGHFVVNSVAKPGVKQRFEMVQEYFGTKPSIEALVNKGFRSITIAIPEDMRYDFILAPVKWDEKDKEGTAGVDQKVVFNIEGRQNVMHGYGIRWFDNDAANRDKIAARWEGKENQTSDVKLATVNRDYSVYSNNVLDTNDKTNVKTYPDGMKYSNYDYYYNGIKITTYADADNKGKYDNELLAIAEKSQAPYASLKVKDGEKYKLKGEKVLKNDTKYLYNSVGDYRTFHVLSMREALNVEFNTGKGKLAEDGKAGVKIDDSQEIGHSEKIKGNESGREITFPDGSKLIPPAKPEDQTTENEFKGWNTDANATAPLKQDELDALTFTEKTTTFYAIYGPKDDYHIKYEYVDESGTAIDAKYKIDDQKYPARQSGKKDQAISAEHLKAPKFLGYELKQTKTDPVPEQGKQATYTKDGTYTVKFIYKKLDPIIPEDKASEDVKKTYIPVTWKIDETKGEFKKDGAAVADASITYYVNPVENKTFTDVVNKAGLVAASKDENKYKLNTDNPNTFDPAKVKSQKGDQEPTLTVEDGTEITNWRFTVDKGLVATVNFEETKAEQFKDKLKPVDIKVWEKDPIDWKKGVELKDANEDLQKILDENTTVVTDENNRTSATANLPNGEKGNLKVTFSDGSSVIVKEQTLYVAPHKNDNNKNLPKDAVKVEFKIGEGVTGTEKTMYVKPGTDVKSDAPAVNLKKGYKDFKWYKGNEVAKDEDFKVSSEVVFTANAGQTDAQKYGDQLEVQDIVKWVGDQVDWKDGVKPIEGVTFKNVEDLSNRSTANAGVFTGKLKVTFGDDSTKEIDGQRLIVRAKKGDKVTPSNDDPGTYPEDARNVKFVAGNGIQALNPDNKEMVLQKDEALEANDYPTVTVKANHETKANNVDYYDVQPGKLTAKETTITASTTEKGKKDVEFSFEFYNSKKPTEQILASVLKGRFEPTVPEKQTGKYVGSDITLPTFENKDVNTGDLQGTWKFDGWYRNGNKLTEAKVSANDAENKLVGKWILTETETAKVTREFAIDPAIVGADKDVPTSHALPKAVKDQKPNDTTNYIGSEQTPGKDKFNKVDEEINGKQGTWTFKAWNKTKLTVDANEANNVFTGTWTWTEKGKINIKYVFKGVGTDRALPQEILDQKPTDTSGYQAPADPTLPAVASHDVIVNGDKVGTWTRGDKWKKDTDTDGNITYTLIWTFKEIKSDDPVINPVKPGDKKIEGKGKPGSKVKVTIPGVEKPIEVDVNEKGDWTVEVPKDKKLKDGDVIKAKQKTPGLPESNEVTRKVEGDTPSEPKNYDGYINLEPVGEQEAKRATDIHVIYLYGYQDKTVHPQGDMTRAEAAAMVARLKNLDMSDTSKPDFKDVESRWYNSAINAVVKAGLMKGYPDGTFAPNGKITRAEFAQLIKGIDNPNMAELPFTDVAGHWGLDAISQAYANKRIMGYPDNTFKPNNDITRAEAVTILNSLFDRGINEAGLANVRKDIVEFKDLDRSHWAYYQIIEASNTHEFYRAKDGEVPEVWVRVLKTWNDFLK